MIEKTGFAYLAVLFVFVFIGSFAYSVIETPKELKNGYMLRMAEIEYKLNNKLLLMDYKLKQMDKEYVYRLEIKPWAYKTFRRNNKNATTIAR